MEIQAPAAAVEPTVGQVWDSAVFELFDHGAYRGNEVVEVVRGEGGITLRGRGELVGNRPMRYTAELTLEPSWRTTLSAGFKIEAGKERCAIALRTSDSLLEYVVTKDGRDHVVAREERAGAALYFGLQPVASLVPVCQLAAEAPTQTTSYPGIATVISAAKVRKFTSGGKTQSLSVVTVDSAIEIVCDAGKLAVVHYGKHGFLAARKGYEAAAKELAEGDPAGPAWGVSLTCQTNRFPQ